MYTTYFAVKGIVLITASMLVSGPDAVLCAWSGAVSLGVGVPVFALLEWVSCRV